MNQLKRKAGRRHGRTPYSLLLLAALIFLSACGPSTPAAVNPRLAATVAVLETQNGLPVTGNNGKMTGTQSAGQAKASPIPVIIIQDQNVSGGQVILRTVISDGPGWVVIHATDKNGSVGEVIGYAPVNNGTNNNVHVSIDAQKTTPVLFAELHTDVGQTGSFEYPGPDLPVTRYGQAVLAAFNANAGAALQLDQLNETATASAARGVQKTGASASVGGAEGAANSPAQTASPTPAATATNTPIPTQQATSTLPPSVKAANQPLKNGQVTIAEVVSPGSGWIVVYASNNGSHGAVLGYAQVKNGWNGNVAVPLLPLATSRTLIAVLHTDAGKPGVFEYPGPDGPVTIGQKLIWAKFILTQ